MQSQVPLRSAANGNPGCAEHEPLAAKDLPCFCQYCVCVSCSELRKRKRVLTEEEQLLGETEDGIAEEEKSNAKTAAADEAGMCA